MSFFVCRCILDNYTEAIGRERSNMYRLLIVDNEEYVVDGLVDLFGPDKHPDLETAGAYSAAEALNFLMTTPADIVLTDIRMPGMNGLELQKIIEARWPYCKVLFLSGYDDFNYAQEALRHGAVNYILKTEDDEVIEQAVYAAIELAKQDKESQKVLEHARQQVKQALGALQREFLESLIVGNKQAYLSLDKQLAELQLPLHSDKQLFVVIGKVDEWRPGDSHYDRSLLLFAVQNIADEYLSLSMSHYSFIHDRSKIIWLIQSKAEPWMENIQAASTMALTSRFVYGTFECIQSSCSDLLKLSMSFAVCGQPMAWNQLGSYMEQLQLRMRASFKKAQLYIEDGSDRQDSSMQQKYAVQQQIFKQYEHLSYAMEHRNNEEFDRIFELLLQTGDHSAEAGQAVGCLQITSSLYAIFMSYASKLNTTEAENMPQHLTIMMKQMEQGELISWQSQRSMLISFADYLWQQVLPAGEHEENQVVQNINAYLASNLDGDLSLKTMAFAIGHNPSYLSRLYKQKAGKTLSETINELKLEKAKDLLAGSQYRISDVSKAIGFYSEHYFYRFFKKAMNMTPQEYRDKLVAEQP